MLTQNRSARGKKITEWLKMKVWPITLRWAGLKVWNGCKNSAIVHGRVRDDVEKQMWMKNIDKWRTTTKWRSTVKWRYKNEMKIKNEVKINNNKNFLGGSPKQGTITGSFWLSILKKWLQKCYWSYLYIWYCSSFGIDFDI